MNWMFPYAISIDYCMVGHFVKPVLTLDTDYRFSLLDDIPVTDVRACKVRYLVY